MIIDDGFCDFGGAIEVTTFSSTETLILPRVPYDFGKQGKLKSLDRSGGAGVGFYFADFLAQ